MPEQVMSLIILIVGLLLCFFGFKIQKMLIMVAWFLIGYNLVGYANGYLHLITDSNILIIVSIVVGLLLAGAGFKLEKIALFIAVAYLTFTSIKAYIPISDPRIALLVQAAVSLLVGALSTLFIKVILIGVSSLAGAALVKQYLPLFINIPANILVIVVVVLVVAGIITQLKTS
jgi:hypothetical protein